MPLQLIYTSIREGLDIGRSGFCTVAKTQGMKRALSSELEAISHYDFDKSGSKHIFTYRIISTGDERFYVCSKLAACGVDYTGRTNFIAHHVAFRSNELSSYANPACFMQNWTGWYDSWLGSARELTESEFKNFPLARINKDAKTWASLSKEENKDFLLEAKNISFVDVEESTYLSLLSESFFAQGNKAWNYSFTTRLQKNESVRSYAINLADDFVLSILPEDFLKISPSSYLINLRKTAAAKAKPTSYEAERSMPSKDSSLAQESEELSSLDSFNMPDFDFKKKKSNFSLYLFAGSLLLSLVAGASLFIYLRPKKNDEADISAIYPSQGQMTTSTLPIAAESEIDKADSVAKEEQRLKDEQLELQAYQEAQRLKAVQKAMEKKRKAEEKARKDAENLAKKAKEAQEAQKRIEQEQSKAAKKVDSDVQKVAALFGVVNISDFADVEKVFLAYQRQGDSYLINLAEFKKIYPSLEGSIFDSKKVDIVSSSLDASVKFSFSPNGSTLYLDKNGIQSQVWTSVSTSASAKNAKLENPFFLNCKTKAGDISYGVFFVDDKEIPLNVEVSIAYDISKMVAQKDFLALLNSLAMRTGSSYSLELRANTQAFDKILSTAKQGTLNYDKSKLERTFSDISKNYKDYMSNVEALAKKSKEMPIKPKEENQKDFSGNAIAKSVFDKTDIFFSRESLPVKRFKDVFEKNATGSISGTKNIFDKEINDFKLGFKEDNFFESLKEFYVNRPLHPKQTEGKNDAEKEKLKKKQRIDAEADWNSIEKDLKTRLQTLVKEIEKNANLISTHSANVYIKTSSPDYWKAIDKDMKAIDAAYKNSLKAVDDFRKYSKQLKALEGQQGKAVEGQRKALNKYKIRGQKAIEDYILWKLFNRKLWEGDTPKFLGERSSDKYFYAFLYPNAIFKYENYKAILSDVEAMEFNKGIDDRYATATKAYEKAKKTWDAEMAKIKSAKEKHKQALLRYFSEEEINNDLQMDNLISKGLEFFLNLSKVYIKFNVK